MELLPLWPKLNELCAALKPFARIEDLGEVRHGKLKYPLRSIMLGSKDPTAPTFGLVGGVHGLEVIGTEVILAFLEGVLSRLPWDSTLQHQLKTSRWAFLPLVNPVGMAMGRRSNGNGVDLMRNAPVEAEDRPLFLVGGHRYGPYLPWYRGKLGAPMERENELLMAWVQREFLSSEFSVLVDIHSGFGLKDRLWYPYAKGRRAFPFKQQTLTLEKRLNAALPHHVYLIETQSDVYTTHGDVWDYLVDQVQTPKVFLPLTLELGSWLWLRKNPFQIFSLPGMYNPIKPHRQKRAFRRHLPLFDFLSRVVDSRGSLSTD